MGSIVLVVDRQCPRSTHKTVHTTQQRPVNNVAKKVDFTSNHKTRPPKTSAKTSAWNIKRAKIEKCMGMKSSAFLRRSKKALGKEIETKSSFLRELRRSRKWKLGSLSERKEMEERAVAEKIASPGSVGRRIFLREQRRVLESSLEVKMEEMEIDEDDVFENGMEYEVEGKGDADEQNGYSGE